MLHLVVFAMITAWDIDADASKTSTAQFGQRLAGAQNETDPLGPSAGAESNLVKICTYGAPPLGPHLLSEAPDVMRTFTTPSCDTDGTSDFQSALGGQSLFGSYLLGVATLRTSGIAAGAPVHLTAAEAPSQNRAVVALQRIFPALPTSLSIFPNRAGEREARTRRLR
jgi:hypothetical protein